MNHTISWNLPLPTFENINPYSASCALLFFAHLRQKITDTIYNGWPAKTELEFQWEKKKILA